MTGRSSCCGKANLCHYQFSCWDRTTSGLDFISTRAWPSLTKRIPYLIGRQVLPIAICICGPDKLQLHDRRPRSVSRVFLHLCAGETLAVETAALLEIFPLGGIAS